MLYGVHLENFHSLIVYGLFGTIIAYILVKILIKLKGIEDPVEVSKLMFIPLAIPFIATISSLFYAGNKCLVGFSDKGKFYEIFDGLCRISSFLGNYFTPILLIGTVLALLKNCVSLILIRRHFKRQADIEQGLEDLVDAKLKQLALKAGIKCPSLLISRQNFARCFTFGYRNPTIVLSQGVLKYFEEDEIEAVLAHEIGHIVRADSLRGWIAKFLRDLLFFNPITLLVFRDLASEHEKAADDIAIELTNKPIVFAETLLKFWKFAPQSTIGNLAALNPNFAQDLKGLEIRVKRSISDVIPRRKSWINLVYSSSILITTLGILFVIC